MDRERRWAYLDALKALAIFCVCLYHFPIGITGELTRLLTAGLLTQRFFRGLCSVCVPLFMMVNGALLLSRPFDARRHFVRCAQLFVSLYVWYLLTMVANGEISSEEYMQKLTGFVTRRTDFVKKTNNQSQMTVLYDEAAGYYKK